MSITDPQSLSGLKTNVEARELPDSIPSNISPATVSSPKDTLSDLTTNSGSSSNSDLLQAAEHLDDVEFEFVELTRIYEIGEVIGQGGMGVVYRAVHKQSRHPQAIKRLMPDLVTNRKALSRFQTEGNAMIKLTHDNIVRF